MSAKIVINDLTPSTVYTFCALIKDQFIQTPFQCKSYQTQTPWAQQAWLYKEQKTIIVLSLVMMLLLCFLLGSAMTYLIIRRMPTLMKGSKRVVMVDNRSTDVMVLSSDSRTNSLLKETTSLESTADPQTYLTPLPRKSLENRHV